jgi:predicted RNase H-like HicB family nuclease
MPIYKIEVFWSDEDGGYIAIAPDLPGCSTFGDTPTEAIQEMEDAMASWLQAWVSLGRPLPEPKAMPQQAA